MLRRSDFIAVMYALPFVFANFGIAIAARMPMITTTISSSMRVKPLRFMHYSGEKVSSGSVLLHCTQHWAIHAAPHSGFAFWGKNQTPVMATAAPHGATRSIACATITYAARLSGVDVSTGEFCVSFGEMRSIQKGEKRPAGS